MLLIPEVPGWLEEARETLSYKVKRMKTAQQIEQERLLHEEFKRKLNVQDDIEDDGAVPTTTENIHLAHQRQRKQAPANSSILSSFRFKSQSGVSSSNNSKVLNPMLEQGLSSTTIVDPGGLRAPGGRKAK